MQEIIHICERCKKLSHQKLVNDKKHYLFECDDCNEENYHSNDHENVYVLYSDLAKDLVKIGFTTRNPKERIKELNTPTGSINWKLACKYYTTRGIELEKLFFDSLQNKRVKNKELFKLSVEEIIKQMFDRFLVLPNWYNPEFEVTVSKLEKISKIGRYKFEKEQEHENFLKQIIEKNDLIKNAQKSGKKIIYRSIHKKYYSKGRSAYSYCPKCGIENEFPHSIIKIKCSKCGHVY